MSVKATVVINFERLCDKYERHFCDQVIYFPFFDKCPKFLTSYHTTAQRCRSETETFILEDLFSSVLLQFTKYHSSGNLKFDNLGISQSLKLRNLKGKILRISLKLYITPTTLGCYGLSN